MDKSWVQRFLSDEQGISSIEYALLLAFIGAGVATAALLLGQAVQGKMATATSTINAN